MAPFQPPRHARDRSHGEDFPLLAGQIPHVATGDGGNEPGLEASPRTALRCLALPHSALPRYFFDNFWVFGVFRARVPDQNKGPGTTFRVIFGSILGFRSLVQIFQPFFVFVSGNARGTRKSQTCCIVYKTYTFGTFAGSRKSTKIAFNPPSEHTKKNAKNVKKTMFFVSKSVQEW